MARQATKTNTNTNVDVQSRDTVTQPVETEGLKPKTTEELGEMFKEHKTKSAVIRALAAEGYKTGPIAKMLDIRYQHARNVLHQAAQKKTDAS